MKFLLVALGLIGLVSSEGPYPPSGSKPLGPLLVLPPRQQYTAPIQTSPQDIQVVPSVSLDRLGEIITERLRQADGSQNGNYYVSLPDGRFQNLRYTSAPLKRPSFQNTQQFNFQNSQSFGSASTSQVNQQNSQAGRFQGYMEARPKGEFEESRQSGQRQISSGNRFVQQGYSQDAAGEGAASDQHPETVPSQKQAKPQKVEPNQPEASQNDPAAVQPQQQQLQQPQQLLQHPQQLLQQQAQLLDQQHLLQQQAQLLDQQQWTAGYIAGVQYTDIQPISAPIYSYLPAPLVRILRETSKY